MIENAQQSRELLESETGRFLMEIENSKEDMSIMIDASGVAHELKEKFHTFLDNLISELELVQSAPTETTTFAFSKHIIIEMLFSIDKKDPEQYHLFETVRNAILRAENSALGFSSNYLTK